jgi:hypothetical protein
MLTGVMSGWGIHVVFAMCAMSPVCPTPDIVRHRGEPPLRATRSFHGAPQGCHHSPRRRRTLSAIDEIWRKPSGAASHDLEGVAGFLACGKKVSTSLY